MDTNILLLIEVLLIGGGVIAFALWELRSLKRKPAKAKTSKDEPNT